MTQEKTIEQPIAADIKTTPLPPKKNRGKLRVALLCVAAFLAAAVIFTFLSPLPMAYIGRAFMSGGMSVPPDDYAQRQSRVTAIKNLSYPSKFKDNTADIYLPTGPGPHPVILWAHGGAFVGGDKSDIEVYATALASEGYAAVCINYRRAPEAKYPTPVMQTDEAYAWLKTVAAEHSLDTGRLVLAGDSAGAHIAGQYAAIQINAAYAADMGMEAAVPPETLKAVLLFCGPYSVEKIANTGDVLTRFFLSRMVWAYAGTRHWQDHFSEQGTLINHVTSDFPPAFISDGNTGSFEPHGRELAEKLRQAGAEVDSFFMDTSEAITKHEYQFIMNSPAGIESFKRTLEFLEKHV